VIAYHRHADGGPNDHTLIVANFSARSWTEYEIGAPAAGKWVARFNSQWEGYRHDLENFEVHDIEAKPFGRDGEPASAIVSVAAYSLSIYTLAEA
ncbi:MAG: hypothetical protein JWL90_112, partial [Chthoniobacteraceae bacterium]|nr:hypothetical protein [Chthoniobacteraceae bacterium]